MTNKTETFQIRQKVKVNGNREGRILREYCEGMWEVRLWQGKRLIGDVCVRGNEITEVGNE